MRELATVLRDILNRLEPRWQGLQVAVWLAHFAAWAKDNDLFEVAQAFINSTGGLSRTLLLKPPSTISVSEGNREDQFPPGNEIACPNLTAFREAAMDHYATYLKPDADQVALQALDDDSFFFDWAEAILASL